MDANVVATMHSNDGDRCVKVVKRSDGTFGLDEYRRDPEDAGGWTFVRSAAQANYPTGEKAAAAARAGFGWLRGEKAPTKG
jgi:hypothetical protein